MCVSWQVQPGHHCLRTARFGSNQECAFEAELPVVSSYNALVHITELSWRTCPEFLSDDSRRQLAVLQVVMHTQYIGSY